MKITMKQVLHPADALLAILMMFGLLSMFSTPAAAVDRALSFSVHGVIVDIKVKQGMKIKKGDVLAVLDQRPFVARKKASDVRVEAAKFKYELATRRFGQTQELFDSLSASSEDVENAEAVVATARSKFEDAKAYALIVTWKHEQATLRAPFDGTVTSIPGYPGMVIPRNGDVVPVVVVGVP